MLASPIDGSQRALIENDCRLVSYRPLALASHNQGGRIEASLGFARVEPGGGLSCTGPGRWCSRASNRGTTRCANKECTVVSSHAARLVKRVKPV